MTIIQNGRFSEKDLIGLNHFYDLLDYIYEEQSNVVELVFKQKVYLLSRCPDIEAAQRRLDFEVELAEYYSDLLYFVRDYEMEDRFYDALDEMDDISQIEKIAFNWRKGLQQHFREK